MRKAKPKKRILLPDPKFHDVLVTRFVNNLMLQGKKKEATDVLVKTISIGEAGSLSDSMLFEPLRIYAKLLREEKRLAEAGKFDARVKAVIMANPVRKPPNQ